MGYCGFGMQKWIYTQKARRPFSKDRKPAGDSIETHYENDFFENRSTLKSKKHIITSEDSEKASRRLKLKFIDLNQSLIIKKIALGFIILFAILLTVVIIKNSLITNERTKNINKTLAITVYNEAMRNYEKGEYEAAYGKFLRATKLDPNLFSAYHGMVLTSGQLCNEYEAFCNETLKIIKQIKKKFPDKNISDLNEIASQIKMKYKIN